jgi:hypothetical protein
MQGVACVKFGVLNSGNQCKWKVLLLSSKSYLRLRVRTPARQHIPWSAARKQKVNDVQVDVLVADGLLSLASPTYKI